MTAVLPKGRLRIAGGRVMDDERRAGILNRLKAHQKQYGVSDADLAAIFDISRPAVSQIKRGRYGASLRALDKHLVAFESWLDDRAHRLEIPEGEYVSTSIGENILTICEAAVATASIALIQAAAGTGKTASLREVARRLGPNRSVYFSAGEAMSTKLECMAGLAEAMGLVRASGSSRAIYSRIRDRLAAAWREGRGLTYALLIDETRTLKPSALNCIRNLYDDPQCRPAVVLADTIERMDDVLYARNRAAIAGGNEQLRSRARLRFRWPTDRHVERAHCGPGELPIPAADVKAVVDSTLRAFGHGRAIGGESYRYLSGLARREGGLRNAVIRLQTVQFVAGRHKAHATYSPAELDYVAELCGMARQFKVSANPFATKGRATVKVARRATG